jgi:hypothetical protein
MRGEEGRCFEDGMPTEPPPVCGAMRRRFFSFSQQSHPHTASLSPMQRVKCVRSSQR